jgi:hypothetical protein
VAHLSTGLELPEAFEPSIMIFNIITISACHVELYRKVLSDHNSIHL